MKKLVFLFVCLSSFIQAQSLSELMSEEGLKLGGYYIDDVGFNGVRSYQFCLETTACDLPILQYYGSNAEFINIYICLLYTSPSPRDGLLSRMPSSA